MGRLRACVICALLITCAVPWTPPVGARQAPAGIIVRLGGSVAKEPLDGRLLLLLSKDEAREPRLQVSATSLSSAQVFGIDVEGLEAGEERSFDAAVLGYPIESLRDVTPGEYTVQAYLDALLVETPCRAELARDGARGLHERDPSGGIGRACDTLVRLCCTDHGDPGIGRLRRGDCGIQGCGRERSGAYSDARHVAIDSIGAVAPQC
jgi:hypothetical protein